ncbi:hypothetical protein SAMN04488003_10833 [Loktanella fryxellensis]|uniref:Uncharacterized protein n=1 Tax=Loktanella fryxellensis TaxID=245187 RepID=A0A1H8D6Q0_9RHOB|nr:hypothetical protein [Loktanella fryxellensis]SEN02981.1 hypothetical protein SAMN04488003_10833 [Loktanella fryxellensis]
MMKILMSVAGLAALAACATPVPVGFDGNTAGDGTSTQVLIIPPAPQPVAVPQPAPVRTTSLDGPASSPIPRPSTNGMQPPPVEIGVLGAAPAPTPTIPDAAVRPTGMTTGPATGTTPAATLPTSEGNLPPLVMDEDA